MVVVGRLVAGVHAIVQAIGVAVAEPATGVVVAIHQPVGVHGAHAVAQLHGVHVAAPVIGEVVATVQPVGVAGVLAPEPVHGVHAVATALATTVQPAMAHGVIVQRIATPLGEVVLAHPVHVAIHPRVGEAIILVQKPAQPRQQRQVAVLNQP